MSFLKLNNLLCAFCNREIDIGIVFNYFGVENLVLQLFSKIEIYSLALHLLLEILLLRYHQQRKSMDVFKFRKFISGSLVFWFFGSLVHLGFTKLPLKKKNLFWLVGAVKYYFANLSINECSISKRYITLHINGWQQPVESVRDLGGRLVVGWSGSRTDQRQPEAATVSYSKASHGERCKTGSWRFFWGVTFLSCYFFKSNRT